MKKLLTLLTAILLVSCDSWTQEAEQRDKLIASLRVGNEWIDVQNYYLHLKEANTECTKFCIEGLRGYYYITVKDKHIVSIWVKPKPY
jgi:hypothetical protein